MDRWEPRFEFYLSERNGDPCSTFLDLEARRHAPVASHPVALWARLAMREPRPDGLRSAEEAPGLFAYEDRLVDRLCRALDAIYVGRLVQQGRTDFLFYLPPSTDVEPAAAVAALEPYSLSFTRVLDRNWAEYDAIYPRAREWRQIMDHRLLEALGDRGDQPELPRDVDHLVYFEDRAAAEAAARALAERGFRYFGKPVTEHDGKFSVAFHRVETCRPRDVSRFVDEILDVVLPLGGHYDGWGCEVQAARRDSDGA